MLLRGRPAAQQRLCLHPRLKRDGLPRPPMPQQLRHRRRMESRRVLIKSDADVSHYTHLFVCISEEEDGYTVQIRLYNQAGPENAAWGEEIADSLEMASSLVAAVAAEFSIPQEHIKIEIRMDNLADGTHH
jgi:hypothetical protein